VKRWWVVTPAFPYMYDVCDVIEVEAETPRDAVKLGVKAMLADHRLYRYCHEQRQDGACPYTRVHAIPCEEERTFDP
jgi:hypothetical protein